VREPADAFCRIETSRAETHEPDPSWHLFICAWACPHTVSPFTRSCAASGGASSFLLASALRAHLARAFRLARGRGPRRTVFDASNRLLPPERLTFTRTSCVPGSLPRLSPRGGPARSLASKNVPGREAFHDASDASADRCSCRTAMCLQSLRVSVEPSGVSSVGLLVPRSEPAIVPLTLLSPLPLPPE